MSDVNWLRNYALNMPPAVGSMARITANTTVNALDLTTLAGSPVNQVSGGSGGGDGGNAPNPLGHFLTLQVDAGTVWFAFADTYANATGVDVSTVSTCNANTGALSANYTQKAMMACTAGVGGGYLRFYLPPGKNPQTTPFANNSPIRFMSFATSANSSNFVVYMSAP